MKKLTLYILTALFAPSLLAQNSTHLNFDGDNDIVTLGNEITNYFAGKNKLTIEATVRPENITGFGVIAANYDYPSNNDSLQFMLRRENENYVFFIYTETNTYSIGAPNTAKVNEWQHVAGVLSNDSIKIFIDGKQMNSRDFTGVLPAISNEFVLGSNSINEKFDGDIEEVRVWNTAVSSVDMARRWACELNGNEEGLLAYYQLNSAMISNPDDTTLIDLTGNGYNGTLRNFDFSGESSNWDDSSRVLTGITIPELPSEALSEITINLGDTIPELNVSTLANELRWYSSNITLTGSNIPPTLSSLNIDTTDLWISSYDMAGCESERIMIRVIIQDVLAVDNLKVSTISYYPNPVNSSLQIETDYKGAFVLYNSLGIVIMKSDLPIGTSSIDVSDLNSGNYIFIIEDELSLYQSALIIE